MPVRIQGRLLAELGAMLGLCLAAAGCQMNPVRNDTPPPMVGYNEPTDKPTSPLLNFIRGDHHPYAQAPAQGQITQGQIVSMSRPIPMAADSNTVPTASGWNPIQRTSAEQAEPTSATQDQVLASSPGVMLPDTSAAQPLIDPPGQLNPATPLAPQPILEAPGPGCHHGGGPGDVAPPREFDKHSYPLYVIEPPDILLIQFSKGVADQPATRVQSPVAMDGTINLGIYGLVYVAGMTVEQARLAVTAKLAERIKFEGEPQRAVSVEVLAYNSKVYYIITDGGGYGQQVARFPATGNETVLDALSQIGGLPAVASHKKIWLARATPDHSQPIILPIDWNGVSQHGSGGTNYQIFPGDRIYVGSDPWVRGDTWIARRLAPVQNILGTILLGSTTVNSLKGKTGGAP